MPLRCRVVAAGRFSYARFQGNCVAKLMRAEQNRRLLSMTFRSFPNVGRNWQRVLGNAFLMRKWKKFKKTHSRCLHSQSGRKVTRQIAWWPCGGENGKIVRENNLLTQSHLLLRSRRTLLLRWGPLSPLRFIQLCLYLKP